MRYITEKEYNLVKFLIEKIGLKSKSIMLSKKLLVEELKDGGMGSLRFHYTDINLDKRQFGKAIVEARYLDKDGIMVSVVVNIDSEGFIYELDVWKVNSSPVKISPDPSVLREIIPNL
jgi:hypothetical protein